MKVFLSIILILSGIIIRALMIDSRTNLDEELVGFFTGLVLGLGVGLLISVFFKKGSKA